MAKRTTALLNGEIIGIESIYTLVNGKQINIPEKLKALREHSRRGELSCPCGCGGTLILVAGERNLREQHFRMKEGSGSLSCHALTESSNSIQSKIVLKCWLDSLLGGDSKIRARVRVSELGESDRRFEFTFLSREHRVGLSYCNMNENVYAEKLSALDAFKKSIKLIYVLDHKNENLSGQYPEKEMMIQKRQGFCLFLRQKEADYASARMEAVFYTKDLNRIWREVGLCEGPLSSFGLEEEMGLTFEGVPLSLILSDTEALWFEKLCSELKEREERERQRKEQERQRELLRERAEQEALKKARELLFKEQPVPRRMPPAERSAPGETGDLVTCRFCKKRADEGDFVSYEGGPNGRIGVCKDCYGKHPEHLRELKEREEALLEAGKRRERSRMSRFRRGGF